MERMILFWRWIRHVSGRIGGRLNRDAVLKDARDIGKILLVSGFLGLIADNGGWKYLVPMVLGVLLYVWASVNEG